LTQVGEHSAGYNMQDLLKEAIQTVTKPRKHMRAKE